MALHFDAIIRIFSAAALLAVLGACNGACSQNNSKAVSIRVGILKDITAGPELIAAAQGYFTAAGLNVTFEHYETGSQASEALIAGKVDIAGMAEFIMVRNALRNEPVSIIASDSKYEGVLLAARKSSGIDNVTRLKGQRVGVNMATENYFYLSRLLERNNLSLEDITTVNGTHSQLIELYNRGEINAVVFTRLYVDQLMPQSDILTWAAHGNQSGYRLVAVRSDRIAANQELIKRYLGAIYAAENYIFNRQADAKLLIAKEHGFDPGYIESEWPLTRFGLSLDMALIAIMNDQAHWMNEKSMEAAPIPDFAMFFYVDGLRAVKPEAVTIIR